MTITIFLGNLSLLVYISVSHISMFYYDKRAVLNFDPLIRNFNSMYEVMCSIDTNLKNTEPLTN
jgi:hypothetical protein